MVSEPLKGLGRVECMLEVGESIGESNMVTNVDLAGDLNKQQEKNRLQLFQINPQISFGFLLR